MPTKKDKKKPVKKKKKGENFQHLETTKQRIINRHKMLQNI